MEKLTYFNRSRRRFLQLTRLTLTHLFLPKVLLSGSQTIPERVESRVDNAIAMALQDVGVKVATNVPSTGETAIFDAYTFVQGINPCYAFNEEVAYTIAHGAAFAGIRSAAVVKSHGIAKAANSVVDSITLGTTAGFVAITIDDPEGLHSDTSFECETFLKGTGIPFKKTTDKTIYNALIECFLWSEELGIPVALLLDPKIINEKTSFERKRLSPPKVKYRRDPMRHVLCPILAPYQRKILEAKLARRDWRFLPVPSMPIIPDGLQPAWRAAAAHYIPIFEVFKELRQYIPFVSGDTGLSALFAFSPFSCIDTCSYYGGSLPLAIGFHLAGFKHAWAVTGDYAFLAAGHMGLIEAFTRRISLKVMVMDNGKSMATGGQPIPEGVFEQVLSGWNSYVTWIHNPRDRDNVKKILTRANHSDRMEILVARFRS